MSHLVLLGDSIFDNGAYTRGGPDVITQVRAMLPNPWSATLLAVDGSTTEDVPMQLDRVPGDATHLVLSAGGNDVLHHVSVLDEPVASVAEAVERLATVAWEFEERYDTAVVTALAAGLPLAVCTIYNGCFEDPSVQRVASAALSLFNDAIIRIAAAHGVSVIDLRSICTRRVDFANPIEPSAVGGQKIARVIVELVTGVHAASAGTRLVVFRE
jgi:hypothetical protein